MYYSSTVCRIRTNKITSLRFLNVCTRSASVDAEDGVVVFTHPSRGSILLLFTESTVAMRLLMIYGRFYYLRRLTKVYRM